MGSDTRGTRSKPGCLPALPAQRRKVSPLEEKNAPLERPQCPGLAPVSPSPACWRTLSRKQDHPRMLTSFLQVCQFNARFMHNTEKAYAQITKPLRDLTRKNTKFHWTAHCQQAYKEILQTMTSNTALRPFDPTLKAIQITDVGPEEIASSLY